MKKKKICYSELAYVLGIITLAIGTAFMERANFGMSMVVAPPYIFYLKISQYISWFTFGMAEYCFQAVLLVFMCLVLRQFKKGYLFSFVTAVIYGIVLDLVMFCVSFIPGEGMAWRFVFYFAGMIICALGITFFFHTYIAPEVYELFVKEVSGKYKINIGIVKTVYDCSSCLLGIILSFAFFGFGHFEGVKLGTIFCALVNGWLINTIGKKLDEVFEFKDAFRHTYR